MCGPRRSGRLCRASVSPSDPPESCDGQRLTCPPMFTNNPEGFHHVRNFL